MSVQSLRQHSGNSPAIKVKLADLGDVTFVKATTEARKNKFIAAYCYADKWYVLLGHEQVEEMINQYGADSNQEFVARLVTKHTIKKAEPAQINVKAAVARAAIDNRLSNQDRRDPPGTHAGYNGGYSRW